MVYMIKLQIRRLIHLLTMLINIKNITGSFDLIATPKRETAIKDNQNYPMEVTIANEVVKKTSLWIMVIKRTIQLQQR